MRGDGLRRRLLPLLLILPLPGCAAEGPQLGVVDLPPGFTIDTFAGDVPGARSLTVGEQGTVFVGSRGAGRVYALVDADRDGRAERTHVLAEGLNSPNGVAFHGGDLYVAEIHRILRFADIERQLEAPPEPEVVTADLPSEGHHGWRYIAFGPDGDLYVAVGAPCNVCDREGFAQIRRLDLESGEWRVHARGVRNSVGFDWHPETGVLWFTDNGRDWLGDNLPPDELNRAPEPGLHFGFPYCHGGTVVDPDFGEPGACDDPVPPAQPLGPHVAALGMAFYDGDRFPDRYRGSVFIAEHGSWNRSEKIGYRISRVPVAGGEAQGYETFASGWLAGGRVWGRPVDVQVMPDGALLVSDDKAGAVYRIDHPGGPAPGG